MIILCASITPTVLQTGEPLSLVLIVLAAITAAVSVAVIVIYTIHRNHRLIKATSKELSAVILSGWYNTLTSLKVT
jgi:hypothetical protein